ADAAGRHQTVHQVEGQPNLVRLEHSQPGHRVLHAKLAGQATQAVFFGALHALAVWLGPFLVLIFSSKAPEWVVKMVSFSPPLALNALASGLQWSMERRVAGGGYETYSLKPDWRWSAAFLAIEAVLFGVLLVGKHRRGAKGQLDL
ncbi:MAG: hypothetical protein NTW86_05215, partial [Candidatus Sumerlaeota bacterium]|nr:hypothetical protein [Candidatus Sumerlaeota bacterium]